MLPTITGIIDRRILLNFRAAPAEVAALLPAGMRVREVNGYALVGVCLIRFKQLRPKGLPRFLGLGSENAAFRISTAWMDGGAARTGVFVCQRVTNSRFVRATGGRVFPGVHRLASFACTEHEAEVAITVTIPGASHVRIVGRIDDRFASKVFDSHAQASEFFKLDRIGYSPGSRPERIEGLELACDDWVTAPLSASVHEVPFFQDLIPSCAYDHALIMHGISHQWHGVRDFPLPRSEHAGCPC
jgi:hypothetical protein